MQEMEVLGVRMRPESGDVVVVLRSKDGSVLLPILTGPKEGAAIAAAHVGIKPARPQTHDLLASVILALGGRLTHVEIPRIVAGVFFAELVFADDLRVDCRASDAIALALRAEVPVRCARAVLAEAGEGPEPGEEEEVLRFREFLNHISPEDFAG